MTKKKGVTTPQKKLPEALEKFKWQPGQCPNPAGRPKGSRNKLGEEFVAALQSDFEQHGHDTIKKVREDRPQDYLKVIASILPKEFNVNTNALGEISDDELAAAISALQAIIAANEAQGGSAEETRH